MRIAICASLLLLTACVQQATPAIERTFTRADPYVDALVDKALALRLHERRQWLRLGHYRSPRLGSGYRSEADGALFFMSPEGKNDPRAELIATLRGFFEPPVEEPPLGKLAPVRHPLCRFPARFAYLSRELAIDPAKLPPQRCPRLFDFLQKLNPRSVTLVFSSYYLNNPASAFGHTFLRFNKAQTMAVGERRELLDYAIDFSAEVDTGNALLYAFKGVFGLFPGTVKRMPYYFKVRQYADTESRDIWEYELALEPAELYMLAAHIWEAAQTHFDYFYLDENCSYRINMLLEVARPDLELVDSLGGAVLPVDTVKALFDNPGLVRDVRYRPSLRTQLLWAVEGLDGEQRDHVELLAEDPDTPLPKAWSRDAQAHTLDAALDLVDKRYMKDLVWKKDGAAAALKQRLLERRAALGLVTPVPEHEPPLERRPDTGHGSRRIGLAGGLRSADGALLDGGFATLDFRLALHDLADPARGYPELATLEFLPLRVRLWPSQRSPRLTLDNLSIMRVVSLSSFDRFDMSFSWKFEVGALTLEHEGCERCLAVRVRGGTGPAKAFFDDALTVFAIADAAVIAASEDDSGIAGSFARAGIGPLVGLRLRLHSDLVVLATGEWMFYPHQPDAQVRQLDAVVRLGLGGQAALSLEGRAREDRQEAQLFVMHYF